MDGMARHDLNLHRTNRLRIEARAAQLLYTYARGYPRSRAERSRCREDTLHFLDTLGRKAQRFRLDPREVLEWLES